MFLGDTLASETCNYYALNMFKATIRPCHKHPTCLYSSAEIPHLWLNKAFFIYFCQSIQNVPMALTLQYIFIKCTQLSYAWDKGNETQMLSESNTLSCIHFSSAWFTIMFIWGRVCVIGFLSGASILCVGYLFIYSFVYALYLFHGLGGVRRGSRGREDVTYPLTHSPHITFHLRQGR